MKEPDTLTIARHTAAIVAAYVGRNAISPADLPKLIGSVSAAIAGLGKPVEPVPEPPTPAVPVRRSITPEAITCLCCGMPFKALKRHLRTMHDLTPDGYRKRFGLADDYPLVAPNYSAFRSQAAKAMGLGRET